MTQLERIAHYEELLDRVQAAAAELDQALTAFAAAQPLVRALDRYYGSDQWRRDYDDDEAGRLPAHLKRGVLSQDALYNALCDNRELLVRMLETAKRAMGDA